jgi:hypothetical protein
MVGRAIEMGGTITGEHGIGLVKRDFLPHEIGQDAVDAMRRVSTAVAPFLNPRARTDSSGIDQASLRPVVPAELRQSDSCGGEQIE